MAAIGRFAGQGLRLLVDLRLMLDELLDLAGQLGDLQPPQQDLLLDLDPHEDFAALVAGGLEGLDALGVVVQVGLLQDVDDLLHLLLDHLVEMVAHGPDLAVPGMRREVVVAKLLKLHVEHFAHKLPGDVAGLLLDLFLLLQSLGRNGLRQRLRRNEGHGVRRRSPGQSRAASVERLHCVSPRPECFLRMSSNTPADFWSASYMLASNPRRSVT